MTYDPERRRRSIRFKAYDYSQAGAYFMTICTQDRACLFGEIVAREMRLNDTGRVAEACLLDIPNHFPHVELDAFVIMPNHVHGVVVVTPGFTSHLVGAIHESPLRPPDDMQIRRKMLLPRIVGRFKMNPAKQINIHRGTPGAPVWQRNYYEHVIRNAESLNRIRQYIVDNSARWAFDRENHNAGEPEREDAWRV